MIKINDIKLSRFLKYSQIFLMLIIYGILLTFFITSLFTSQEFKITPYNLNQHNNLILGLVSFNWYTNSCEMSPASIIYICLLSICYIWFIFNMMFLKIRYFYLNNYFKFFMLFLICSLTLWIIICIFSFTNIKVEPFQPTTSSKIFNLLINYEIKQSISDPNQFIFSTSLSTNGLIFCIIGSIWIGLLFYFPFKIIYNLVKIKYI